MKTPVMVDATLLFDMNDYGHMSELMDSINEGTSFMKEGVVDVNSQKMLLWIKPRRMENTAQLVMDLKPKDKKNVN